MFKRSYIDTAKIICKIWKVEVISLSWKNILSGRHQLVKRKHMISCLKSRTDFSPCQFVLQKSLRPRAFHSVLHPAGFLNQNPSTKMPPYITSAKNTSKVFLAMRMWRVHKIDFIYMTQYKDFRLANQQTYCSIIKFEVTGSKYTGYEFSNKNHFSVLQLRKIINFSAI